MCASLIISFMEIFDRYYRCYPAVGDRDRHAGNKVNLPASALYSISGMDVQWPLFFTISNADVADDDVEGRRRTSHCGVLEFTAEEGTVLVPSFLMTNLHLRERSLVRIVYAALPVAASLKLQPHAKAFFDNLSNVRAVLEVVLRDFACVSVGDTFFVPWNGREYAVDVVETKPSDAVSIIDTDCAVDFAPALDDVQQASPPAVRKVDVVGVEKVEHGRPREEGKSELPKFVAFSGHGRRLDGKVVVGKMVQPDGGVQLTSDEVCGGKHGHGKEVEEEPKFKAFTGKKYTLM